MAAPASTWCRAAYALWGPASTGSMDGVRFEVLHPTLDDTERRDRLAPNAMSCVLRVSTSGAGLAQRAADGRHRGGAGARRACTRAHTRGHLVQHGVDRAPPWQPTSSTQEFLEAVQPEQTLVQVGRRNRYGHPAPTVLARYQGLGLPVMATPACGAWLSFLNPCTRAGTAAGERRACKRRGFVRVVRRGQRASRSARRRGQAASPLTLSEPLHLRRDGACKLRA